ncbi:MAG: glycoside hydrolase family 172 protein [Candidatus Hodarchaeota archaeon]
MEIGYSSLSDLAKIKKNVKRKRISSYDRKGANNDFKLINSKEKIEICNISGSGIIKHIWMTLGVKDEDPYYLRKVIIRMWWDNELNPSVEVPIGDFFGVGHAKSINFWSLPLSMSPQDGKGFNCFWPMPFSLQAKIEIENETDTTLIFFYYIDYEEYNELDSSFGRFHAYWNRENPCKGNDYSLKKSQQWQKRNKNHEEDYLVLDAEGEGQYVGCHLDIHNLYETEKQNWPGEGDDYIEIDDGEIILYGTGTEDYFCTAWGPAQYYCSPYFGIPLPGGKNWSGKISYYRYHIEDPIYFHKNIRVKIEHGHANQRSDDWSSTAYWYQTEPHKPFKSLLPVNERLPRDVPKEIE